MSWVKRRVAPSGDVCFKFLVLAASAEFGWRKGGTGTNIPSKFILGRAFGSSQVTELEKARLLDFCKFWPGCYAATWPDHVWCPDRRHQPPLELRWLTSIFVCPFRLCFDMKGATVTDADTGRLRCAAEVSDAILEL